MIHVAAISEAFSQIIYAVASIMGASVFADCISSLYAAWQRAQMRLEDERWLRDNCKDPVFFTNLKSYTTVCSEVEANARVGAFWYALHEVTDSMRIAWQPWMAGWAIAAFTGVLLLFWTCSSALGANACLRRRHDYAFKDTLA